MLMRFISELGPWSWVVLGLILLGAEVLAPGNILIWIGIAALAVGAASLALWSFAFWTWQVQMLVFAVLAVIAAIAGRSLFRRKTESDQPLLNKRAGQLVGRTATLAEPIVNGRGRIRIDDTTWRVSGPDLEAGSRVRVIRAESGGLEVDRA